MHSIDVSSNLIQWNIDQRQILSPLELQWFSLLNLDGCIKQTATMVDSNHLGDTQNDVLAMALAQEVVITV